jgi:hypothetical protein
MTKKASPPRIPPLSFEVLRDFEVIEIYVDGALLEAHNDPARGQNFTTPKAMHILRACVAKLLTIQLNYYASLPSYRPQWDVEIARNTVDCLLGMFPVFAPREPYRPELEQTANDYLRGRSSAKAPPIPQSVTPARESVGSHLEALRSECRMTVEDLAEALEVTPRSVYRYLSGQATPRDRQIAAYEQLFSHKLGRKVHLETSVKRQ